MSNNIYEQRELFCKRGNMKEPRVKIHFNVIPGICLGLHFPMTYYCDASISLLFINISIKWRKR